MDKLFIFAIAPTLAILFYIYIKDKYEKEPKTLALKGLFFGIIISMPIVFTENILERFAPYGNTIYYAFFISFVVASFVEEAYKYIVLYFLIWKNKNFNEPFDGIVYGVFVSLGFAGVENILYVLNPKYGGIYTALGRAIFSVPAHALFGLFMGYYMSINKFKIKKYTIILSFVVPFFLHGIYDILLFTNIPFNGAFFLILYIYMIISGIFKAKFYLKISPFKIKN